MKRIGPIVVLILTLLLPTGTVANVAIDTATNAYRASQGLSAIATDAAAQAVATMRAQHIAATGQLAHPTSWGAIYAMLPSCTQGVGENIAFRGDGDPSNDGTQIVQAWIDSPSHRANIVGKWDGMGSATVRAGTRTYAVQFFVAGCGDADPPGNTTQPPPPQAPASVAPQPALLMLPNTATSTECLTNSQPHKLNPTLDPTTSSPSPRKTAPSAFTPE